MKRIISFFILLFIILVATGCNKENSNPLITMDYLKEHAMIGMTEQEIRDAFGQEIFRDFGDGSDVWIFDKTKKDYKYTPDLQHVAFEAIKNGDIEYQLYINLKDSKAFMYSYFYKGSNDEVWLFTITPDGNQKNMQSSYTN